MQRPMTLPSRTLRAAKSVVVAVADVIVRHGAEPPLLHRQAGLAAIEGLNLALFIDRQHDGVGRGINVEADDLAELVGESLVVGELGED
jgi:hypothetical protein